MFHIFIICPEGPGYMIRLNHLSIFQFSKFTTHIPAYTCKLETFVGSKLRKTLVILKIVLSDKMKREPKLSISIIFCGCCELPATWLHQ